MTPFPPFGPDMGIHATDWCSEAVNILPRANGWGPFPSAAVFSEALSGAPIGGISYPSNSGTWFTFVATDDGKIQELGYSGAWTTRATGLTGPVSGETWSFIPFAPYIIALSGQDNNKYIDLGNTAAGFIDIPGSPPKAKNGWVANNRLNIGGIENLPNDTRWCAVNDLSSWTIGYSGADTQTFPDGGAVTGGVGIGLNAYVFLQDKIVQQRYVGGSYIFQFPDANPKRGAIAPKSIVQADNQIFYLSRRGFSQGVEGVPIGLERVDAWFMERVDPSSIDQVRGSHDPLNNMVWWEFPTSGGWQTLGYHYDFNRWTTLDHNYSGLFPVSTAGMTLADIAALYPTLESVPLPFGSSVWRGGRPVFAGFDTDNKMVFFSGNSAEAKISTNLLKYSDSRRAFVRGIEIETDATNFTGRVGSADTHAGAIRYTSNTGPNSIGTIPLRSNARLHKLEINIPSGEQWSHIRGFTPSIRAAGRVL